MATLPLVLVLGVLTYLLIKKKKVKGPAVSLGAALGLALAATAVGPPIASGVQAMSSACGDIVVETAKATPAFFADLAKAVS